jgi:hypothetical protein
MQIFSSDHSILVQKTQDCNWDLRVDPLILNPNNPGGSILLNDTLSILLAGNGLTVPITATAKISSTSGNALTLVADGLFVSPSSTDYTNEDARQAISGTSPIQYNSTTGVISILTSSTTQTGALTATDWNSFNSRVVNATNIGSGYGIFNQKTAGNILEFKRIQSGANITITESAGTITISGVGGVGGDYDDTDARNAISGLSPIVYNSTTGVISIQQANGSQNGYISNVDWNRFDQKVPQTRLINTIGPLLGGGNLSTDLTLSMSQANTGQDGWISSTDWNFFNQKQNPITWQNVSAGSNKILLGGTPAGSVFHPFSIDVVEINLNRANFSGITPITGGGTGANNAPNAINNLLPSQTGNAGKVLGTDGGVASWVTNAGSGGGGENPLTVVTPLTRTGDVVSILQSGTTQDGFLTSANWNFFANKIDDGATVGAGGAGTATVFAGKLGTNLQFKRLIASTNITLAEDATTISISATGGGGGGGFNTTVAALKANNATQTAAPYYITNVKQEGFYYYDASGGSTVSNGGSTNAGGTVIRSADGRVFRRSYSDGRLEFTWFGGLEGSANAASNVVAMTAMKAAVQSGEIIHVAEGDWWFNAAISFGSTSSFKSHVIIDGNTSFTSADGFILKNEWAQIFYHNGFIWGPNALTTTEAGYNAFVEGAGIRMSNLYHGDIKVNRIQKWFYGVYYVGEGVGIPFTGSQSNKFVFDWIDNNHTQIYITRLMGASSGAHFANECFWYGGQIGKWTGLPGATETVKSGVNGLVMKNGPGAFDASYGITGHYFYNVNFEGAKNGVSIDNASFTHFVGCSFEGSSMTTKLSLSNTTALNTSFDANCLIFDIYFEPGRKGTGTTVANSSMWSTNDPATFVNQVPIGTSAVSQVPLGIDNLLVSSELYPGGTAMNIMLNSDMWIKRAQFPTIYHGSTRYAGTLRNGAYHSSAITISSSTAPTIVDLPANVGYIRYDASAAKTLRINASDLVSIVGPETFYIEINNTLYPTITRADTDVVLIPSSTFTSTGLWMCVWRRNIGGTAGEYYVTKVGGTGGGAITLAAIGATPNANAATLTGSVLNLQPASTSFGGVITTGTQSLAGIKTWTSTQIFRAGSTASGTAPIKLQAGSLMTIQEPGAIENTGAYIFYTDALQNRYPFATSDNDMIFRHKVWWGSTIAWQYGGTGLSIIGLPGQVLTVNGTGDGYTFSTPAGLNQNYQMVRGMGNNISANNTASVVAIISGDTPKYGPAATKHKLRLTGFMSTNTNASDQITFSINIGGGLIIDATFVPLMFYIGHVQQASPFEFDVDIQYKGGTTYAYSWFFKGYNPSGFSYAADHWESTTGWNNTSTTPIDVTVQWTAANVNNRVTINSAVAELYRFQ